MFKPSTMFLLCGVIAAAPPAWAGSKKKINEPPPTFSSRTDHKDGSSSLTFGTRLPTAVETRMGIDLGFAGSGDLAPIPAPLLERPSDQGTGTGWASMVVPTMPLGFAKAQVDARIDPAHEQSKLGVAVSRPIADGLLMTLQNSYAVTGTMPVLSGAQEYATETGSTVRFDVLSTHTAFSAGTRSSTLDDKQYRTISAEQKIVGPLSISGSLSETPTGLIDKVFRAGFKKTW